MEGKSVTVGSRQFEGVAESKEAAKFSCIL
jgi:hypothetical protein